MLNLFGVSVILLYHFFLYIFFCFACFYCIQYFYTGNIFSFFKMDRRRNSHFSLDFICVLRYLICHKTLATIHHKNFHLMSPWYELCKLNIRHKEVSVTDIYENKYNFTHLILNL